LLTNFPMADLVIRAQPVDELEARCELPSPGGDNKVARTINVLREVVCPEDRPCLSGFFEPIDIRLDDFSTPCTS